MSSDPLPAPGDLGRRIMVVGGPGSGKSTLARALGVRLDLPVHHMDRIHWLPGFVQRVDDERVAMALAVEETEAWVFEGGLSKTYDHRASRASALVWLDLPLPLRFARVIWRTLSMRGETRPDLPEGCPERMDAGKLELLAYMWRSRNSARARVRRLIADHPSLPVHYLRRPVEVSDFLMQLQGAALPRP